MTYAAKTAAAGGSSEGSGDAQRHPIRFIIFHAKDGRAHFFRSALENPYPLYAELRDQAAAVRLRPLGMYALPRYQTVRDALQDWQTFSSAQGNTMNEPVNRAIAATTLGSHPLSRAARALRRGDPV